MRPYYEHAGITIYLGDCRTVLPSLDPVDLVLTDPPYGTEDLGGGYGRRRLHDPNGRKGKTIAGDKDLSVVLESCPLIVGLLTDGGYVATFCAARRMLEHGRIFEDAGLEFCGEIVWDKGAPGLGYTVRYAHESCLLFRLGDRVKPVSPVLSVVREPNDRKSIHPHEKPVKFWSRLATLRDGVILDPFMGSGTVLRAAKDLGRKAIGIEIEEKYCEIAANLLSQEVLF